MHITIRDAQFRIVLGTTDPDVLSAWSKADGRTVTRVDLWPSKGGGAQLGIAWSDGSTYIGDWPVAHDCAAWCRERRHRDAWPTITLHLPATPSRPRQDLEYLRWAAGLWPEGSPERMEYMRRLSAAESFRSNATRG